MKKKLLRLFFMATKLTLYGSLVQCILFSLAIAADSEAQKLKSVNEVEVEVGFVNKNLLEVFDQIESMTDFNFSYFKKDLNQKQRLNIPMAKTTLGQILLKIAEETGLSFKQVNNTITVKINKDNVADKPVEVLLVQTKTVTGKVVSNEDNQPLPGVNIVEKGTTNGTISDIEGDFTLDVSENATLVFSSVGYTSEEVSVAGRSVVNLSMAVDVKALEEIVVVGYGEQKRATVTGSITSVKGADIQKAPITNVSNSLAGVLPGLVAVTRSGEPGYDGSTLRVRGLNTLGENDPLVVVDGIPGRSLDRLDPSSIENITVLKDASAAIYGSQAANGVILITTKRGQIGKPEISINLNQGYGRPTVIPEMANAVEYATMLNEIDVYAGRDPRYSVEDLQKFGDGSDPWSYPNTDWFSEVLKPWSGQNYGNISVSGGNENFKYFLLGGVKGQEGFYKNSGTRYDQYDFRSNLDGKINDNIQLGFDLAARQESRNFPVRSAGNIFRMVMRGKPHMPAYWPDGTPGPDIEYGDNPAVVSTNATGYDRDNRYVLNSNFRLNINIPWIKGLSLNTNAAIDKDFRHRKIFRTPWYLYSWDGQTYGDDGLPELVRGKKGFPDPRLDQSMEDNQRILLNAMVNYEFNLGSDHAFKFMVGSERRTGRGENFSAYRRYFISTAVDQMFAGGDAEKNNNGSASQNARLNYFGRTNYNFKERYLLEFVWRVDGSYIFPKEKRYGFFPGISAGWRISEEDFFKNSITFMDDVKLRASWGQTGNDRIDEYMYLASYALGRWDTRDWSSDAFKNAPYIFGVDQENKALYEAVIPNPIATWEVANQSNVGLETRFLDGRLHFEADYFYNKRTQILLKRNASVPFSTGLTLPPENIGKVANRGFDFNVGYSNQANEFKYSVSMNGGYAKNKILFWDETPGNPEYQKSTGRPMFTNLYYEAIGIFRDEEHLNNYPHISGARPGDIIFRDVNEDGKIDGNDRVRNDRMNIPRFTGGMNFNMSYKNFDLTLLFQGAAGAVQYVSTESGEIGNFLKDFYNNRWTEDNPDASGPRTFNRDNEYWRNNQNTYFLHKTDYVRLKNLEFGYRLPANLIDKLGVNQLRFYVSGFNLLTYSPDYKYFDPENESSSGQSYPLQKVINGGLTLAF